MCGNGVDTVWCKIWEKAGASIVQLSSTEWAHYILIGYHSLLLLLLLLLLPPPTPYFHQMIITIIVIDMIMNEYKSDGHPRSMVARTRFWVWWWKDPTESSESNIILLLHPPPTLQKYFSLLLLFMKINRTIAITHCNKNNSFQEHDLIRMIQNMIMAIMMMMMMIMMIIMIMHGKDF